MPGKNDKAPGNSAKAPGSSLQSWLLLAGGIAGLGLIFYFGYASDLTIRVALALAAAAIAAFIPGFLEVKSTVVRDSGAIAVMIVVLFADDIGRQFSPKSKAPGVPSAVRLTKDQLQYMSEISSAQFEVWQKRDSNEPNRYSVAIETLEHARKLDADPKLALYMLGTLYFLDGNYSRAAESFEQGFRPGDPDGGRLAYNAALAHEAAGETTEAVKWIDLAHKNTSREGHMELWREVNFDRGLIHMIAWMGSDAPKLTRTFEIAIASFQQFLDSESKAVHWAEYDLACLYATSAENHIARKLPPSETYARAARHFEKFLHQVRDLDVDTITLARAVLAIDQNGKREVGGPVACPAIKTAWEGAGLDWGTVLTALSPTRTGAHAASL